MTHARPSGAGTVLPMRVTGLIMVAFVVFSASCTRSGSPEVPDRFELFTGRGFSLAYPPDWVPRPADEQVLAQHDVELEPVDQDGPTPAVAAIVETEQAFAALGVDEFTAAFIAQQRLALPDHEVIDRQPIEVAGAKDANRLTVDYSEPFEDGPQPHREYVVLAIIGEAEAFIMRARPRPSSSGTRSTRSSTRSSSPCASTPTRRS